MSTVETVQSQQRMAQNDMTCHGCMAFSRHGFHKYETCNLFNYLGLI